MFKLNTYVRINLISDEMQNNVTGAVNVLTEMLWENKMGFRYRDVRESHMQLDRPFDVLRYEFPHFLLSI